MKAITLLSEQIAEARGFFEATFSDVTQEQAHWAPPGTAMPMGANYAHVASAQDMAVNGLLKGGAPLAASNWAGKTGMSEPPPGGGAPGDWGDWPRRVRIDLAALRQYAQAVYAATDDYMASLDDQSLGRIVDLSALGLGERSVGWLLNTGVVTNMQLHCGEISCLKGLKGSRGYPA